MRLKLIFLQSLFIALASCTKVHEPNVTSFQLVCTDYVTGDTLPHVNFTMRGIYSNIYDFNAQTNAYGNFDTILLHEKETDFEFLPGVSGDYYLAKKSGNVVNGANTKLDIALMGISTLRYDFDCSGSGYIQNVKHQKLIPVSPQDPFYYNPYGQPGSVYNASCSLTNPFTVFSGEWIIIYDYRPNTALPWIEKRDTVSLDAGEDFIHTIVY